MEVTKAGTNKTLKLFFLKLVALTLLIGLSYHFILRPARIPDKLLTDIITSGTVASLNIFSKGGTHFSWIDYPPGSEAFIKQGEKNVFFIADNCNGLDLLVIYLGFIILLPASIKRKILFGLAGIPVFIVVNIIRCSLLYWIYWNYYSAFEFNHHYTFSIIMYLLIFFGWILFIKKEKKHEIR